MRFGHASGKVILILARVFEEHLPPLFFLNICSIVALAAVPGTNNLPMRSGAHYVTRNRTHRSDFSPFFLRASEIPTIVARCFRLLFWQLLLVIGRVRFLVKPTFFCGWRYACVTEGPPVRLIYWGGTGLHELGAGVHLRRVGMPDESLCPPSPMEIWLYGGRTDRYVSTHLTRL